MQLSVPTLPIDPIVCSAPAGAASASSASLSDNATLSADFGALLTAQTPTAKPATSSETPASALMALATTGQAAAEEDMSVTTTDIEVADTAASDDPSFTDNVLGQTSVLGCLMASIAPANEPNPAPDAAPSGNATESGVEIGTGTPTASPASASSVTAPKMRGNAVASAVARGRPFVGGSLPVTAAASAKAYGLTRTQTASPARPGSGSKPLPEGETSGSADAIPGLATAGSPAPLVGSSTNSPAVSANGQGSAEALAQRAAECHSSPAGDKDAPKSAGIGQETLAATRSSSRPESSAVISGSDSSGKIVLPAAELETTETTSDVYPQALVESDAGEKSVESAELTATQSAAAAEPAVSAASGLDLLAPAGPTRVGFESVAEKIAARLSRNAETPESSGQRVLKNTITSTGQTVKKQFEILGTDVAKTETRMSASAPFSIPAPTIGEKMSFETAAVSFDGSLSDDGDTSGMVEQSANQAVESVMKVADQVASTSQHSVKLQFSVGGEDLAVRVELRGDKVHTTFRADSPELCSALAHEWQAVSSQQGSDRTQRMAEPVFTSASGNSNSSTSDSGTGHSRDQHARHAPTPAEDFGSLIRNSRAQLRAATESTAKNASPVNVNSSSRRLQTFA